MMKNKIWFLIAVIAIIGVIAVSCDNGSTPHTHEWGEWTVTTAATCTAKGVETQTCSTCEATQTREDIPMIDHDWEYLPGANEPTCYAEGSGDRKCRHCPAESKGGTYPKTAHTMSDLHTVRAATCIKAGERESHCLVEECDYEEDDPALTTIPIDNEYGHDYQYDGNSVAPNCVDRGSGTGTCSICTGVINWSSSDKDTDPTNHKSLSADFRVPQGKHATCTAEGESYKFCSACEEFDKTGEGSYEAVAALGGHTYPAATPATCTADSITYACNRMVNGAPCDHENTEKIEPKLKHNFIDWTAPTCTVAGNESRTCTRNCGEKDYIETRTEAEYKALGHALTGTTLVNNNITALTGIAAIIGGCSKNTEASCNPGAQNVTLAEYIQGVEQTGTTAATAVPLKVSINLGAMGTDDNGWTQLLAALNSGGKLVNLDLSDSTMTTAGNAFNTGTSVDMVNFVAFFPDGMYQIASITLPNTTESIGDLDLSFQELGFSGCTNLTSVIIPNSVQTIGTMVFAGTGLTSIIIPNSVTSIERYAFAASGLTSVTFQRADTTIDNENSFPHFYSLVTAYAAGGIGTYTTPNTDLGSVWTKQ